MAKQEAPLISTRQIFGLVLFAMALDAQEDPREFFEKRVRPVLATRCFSCHASSRAGGLRLDSRVSLLEGGKSGPAIVIGQPDDSLLIRAVMQTDDKLKMPMAGGKVKLVLPSFNAKAKSAFISG